MRPAPTPDLFPGVEHLRPTERRPRREQPMSGRAVRRKRAALSRRYTGTSQTSQRRVVVQGRYIRRWDKQTLVKSMRRHVGYLTRNHTARSGEKAVLYGRDVNEVDKDAFIERSAHDPRVFRFTLSPENQELVGPAFTREMVSRWEGVVGARFDFVAADHFNTDNPHTHLVIRGVDRDTGEELFIPKDVMRTGLREIASGVATEWLGRRTTREIESSIRADISKERLTQIDRWLLKEQDAGIAEYRTVPKSRTAQFYRHAKIARLGKIEDLGLATRVSRNTYQLSDQMETVLRERGLDNDYVKLKHRELAARRIVRLGEAVDYDPADAPSPLIGRVVAEKYASHDALFVHTLQGEVHRIRSAEAANKELTPGTLVEVTPDQTRTLANVRAIEHKQAQITRERVPGLER